MSHSVRTDLRPTLERLEPRENPTTLFSDGFDEVIAPTLPTGWNQWSNGGEQQYITSKLLPANGPNALASLGNSSTMSRFWTADRYPNDAAVRATVRSHAPASLEIIARGSGLGGTSPSYVSAVVSPGGGIELVEVRNGVRTSLSKVTPTQPLPYSGVWLTVELRPAGNDVSVVVRRTDDGRYMTANGGWQTGDTAAVSGTTSIQPNEGYAGVGRLAGGSGMAFLDDFSVIAPTDEVVTETFDSTRPSPLPAGWESWASDGSQRAVVGGDRYLSADAALGMSGQSITSVRAWYGQPVPADVSAEVSIYADSLIPSGLFVRGAGLDTTTPTYYAITASRGLSVQLTKVVNGVETSLGSIRSAGYVSGQWVRLTLRATGDQLRGFVYRTDTQQWMAANGTWQNAQEAAFVVTDRSITSAGYAGIERSRLAFGTVWADDFSVRPAESTSGPRVTISPSQSGSTFSGVVQFTASATPANEVVRVVFELDGQVRSVQSAVPAVWDLDTTTLTNGPHTLAVVVVDSNGNSTTERLQFQVENGGSNPDPSRPDGVRKYTHIRLAQLAYSANPMGEYERQLAAESLDLIVPNTRFLQTLENVTADTPKVIYSNVSNLYGALLTDWFDYAATTATDREAAFYHVTQATAFSGASASAVPVREFWRVYRQAANGSGSPTELTAEARGTRSTGVVFGGAGQAVHLGWTDRFREVNFTVQVPAVGWGGRFEYVSEVNPDGSPKTWKTLDLLSNGTSGFTRTGQLLFDPPADWVPAKPAGGSQLLYYIRVVTTGGTGPTAQSLFGRDYVNANGRSTGTIPAFDFTADKNGDGYLNDAEYAGRKSGMDARFVHESRLFYPYYGQMRFVTNPSSVSVRNWAADYHTRLLAEYPLADGVFLDNSNGKLPFAGTPVRESVVTFTQDFADAVGAVTRALPGKWVVANTAGSIGEGDVIAEQSTAVLEEFLLRPNDHNWSNVIDIKNRVDGRLAADSPSPYVIIDTLPGSGTINTERTRQGALAYYYLLADPDYTFLMFFGGYSPSAAWDKVFVPAATYDVGLPVGDMTTFASGSDPQNSALEYKVYAREYEDALVLFKPRSYSLGKGTGTNDYATGTVHQLNGQYRQLYSDGSLGQVVTSIRLQNAEGVVLIKV